MDHAWYRVEFNMPPKNGMYQIRLNEEDDCYYYAEYNGYWFILYDSGAFVMPYGWRENDNNKAEYGKR